MAGRVGKCTLLTFVVRKTFFPKNHEKNVDMYRIFGKIVDKIADKYKISRKIMKKIVDKYKILYYNVLKSLEIISGKLKFKPE